ncbi:MAG: OB-fold nucleic acid binding domain-containing protein [Candidatus Thermoplasmatota archaeon]
MHKTKTELLEFIADIKPKKESEKEINRRYKINEELIDKDTLAFLLVDELGRNTHSITDIANLTPNGEYTVIGNVLSISDSKTFKRKNGSPGKVLNLEITDETATCRLVLWNGDIDAIKNKEIRPGTWIKIINGYTKTGYSGGMEIHLGRWGLLEVQQGEPCSQDTQQIDEREEITGVLVLREPSKAFFKDNGEFRFKTTIMIKEHNIKKQLILWDRNVKDIQSYQIGDTIILRNVTKKWTNGKTEFHVIQNDSVKKRT